MKKAIFGMLTAGLLAGQAWAEPHFEALQKQLGIPPSEGSIVDASGRRPQMILIQDVHRHPEAQEHIRAMILGLRHWGVKEVYLEGAWVRGQQADYDYRGLEQEDTYRENVAAYQAVQDDRDAALQEINTAELLQSAFDADSGPNWNQIERLVELKLKPAEYADYCRHPYHPAAASALSRAMAAAEKFYEVANRRSDIFLARAKEQHADGPQVLVIGGFHTAGMAAKLRAQGISYVVLAPVVTQGGYDDLYSKGMRQTISALKLR